MIESSECLDDIEKTTAQKLTEFLGLSNIQMRITHLLRETLFSLFENVYKTTIQKYSRMVRISGYFVEAGVSKTIKAGLVKTLPYTKEEIKLYYIDQLQSPVVKGMFSEDEAIRQRSALVLQHIANYKSSLPKPFDYSSG